MSENERQIEKQRKINERVAKEMPNKCRERESNEKMKERDEKRERKKVKKINIHRGKMVQTLERVKSVCVCVWERERERDEMLWKRERDREKQRRKKIRKTGGEKERM